MKVDHFTYTDLAKAGPMFHPDSIIRARARDALKSARLAQDVMVKRQGLLDELDLARSHLKLRQRMLYEARSRTSGDALRSLPRVALLTYEADRPRIVQDCGVDFAHALDRLWAAQRGVAMWDHVYGDLL